MAVRGGSRHLAAVVLHDTVFVVEQRLGIGAKQLVPGGPDTRRELIGPVVGNGVVVIGANPAGIDDLLCQRRGGIDEKMFRQDLGTGTRKVLLVGGAPVVPRIEDILQSVIQVRLDPSAIECCAEFRVDLGDEIGLIIATGIRRDIVGPGLAERDTGIDRPVPHLSGRHAAIQAENDRNNGNG